MGSERLKFSLAAFLRMLYEMDFSGKSSATVKGCGLILTFCSVEQHYYNTLPILKVYNQTERINLTK